MTHYHQLMKVLKMPKTSFSKAQLCEMHKVLLEEKMLPCDKVGIWSDPTLSEYNCVITRVKFVKGKDQLDISYITKTHPKNHCLKNQLYKYFVKGEI